MNIALKISVAAACAFLSLSSNAGSLLPAILGGQVQQFTDNGAVSGCGITLFAVELNAPKQALVFNGSAAIYKTGVTAVKGRGSEMDAKLIGSKDFDIKKLKTLKTQMFWLRAKGSPATTIAAGTKFFDSEDKDYRMYVSSFDPVFKFIDSVLTGESVQIGLKVEGRNSEQVLFGTVDISEDEKSQLGACLGELAVQ
jgi:hypothetical protein